MYPETIAPQTEQHLFTEEDLIQYEQAGNSQRFVNLLVDWLLLRFVLVKLAGYVVGIMLGLYFPEFSMKLTDMGLEVLFIMYIVWSLATIFYYTTCEALFRGQTLGKLISGSRAIRDNGEQLRFKDALLRSLCRCVWPFEWFSGFGHRPWHDSLTNTSVVRVR
jgi:uncharacterized RDD family membrane protein YckC